LCVIPRLLRDLMVMIVVCIFYFFVRVASYTLSKEKICPSSSFY